MRKVSIEMGFDQYEVEVDRMSVTLFEEKECPLYMVCRE